MVVSFDRRPVEVMGAFSLLNVSLKPFLLIRLAANSVPVCIKVAWFGGAGAYPSSSGSLSFGGGWLQGASSSFVPVCVGLEMAIIRLRVLGGGGWGLGALSSFLTAEGKLRGCFALAGGGLWLSECLLVVALWRQFT